MRATLIVHLPPKFEESHEDHSQRLGKTVEKVGKALGAETTEVKSGAGYNFEVFYS